MMLAALLAFAALPAPAMAASIEHEGSTETTQGYVVYMPTAEQADEILENQLPNGLVPESNGSAVATAGDSAGKLLVLAAAYKHTGEEKYREGYQKLGTSLRQIESKLGYVPRYFRLDGSPLVTHGDGGKVEDALTLSKMMVNENLPREVTTESVVTLECGFPGNTTNTTNASESTTGSSGIPLVAECPYGISPEQGKGEESAKVLEYVQGGHKTLNVKYTLEKGAIFKEEIEPQDINIDEVSTKDSDGNDVVVSPSSCVAKGIKEKVARTARADALRSIASDILESPQFVRGFSSTKIPGDGTPLEKAAYQARLLAMGEDSVPWDTVRHHKRFMANKYVTLAEDYSLLAGGVSLPLIGKDESTLDYSITSRRDLSFSKVTYGDIEVGEDNRTVKYTGQGLEPRAETVSLEWHPVRERRVHVAGSMTALLESKFGAGMELHDTVAVEELPSGEYRVSVQRDKAFPYEDLNGTVEAWNSGSESRDAKVLYPTLDMMEQQKAYRDALENRSPRKLFVAVDNMNIHLIGGKSAPLDSGVSGVLKAMYSLSDRDIEEVSDDNWKLRRTLYAWKDYYARQTLQRAKDLVRVGIEQDTYSESTEDLLWRLSAEANRTGLDSVEELNDLYSGYKEYFGPHTKNYENLKAMGVHLKTYRPVIEAIERGDYQKARELLKDMPDSTAKQVLSSRVEEKEKGMEKLKSRAFEEVQNILSSGKGDTEEVIGDLERYLEHRDDPKAEYVLGTMKAYKEGVITREKAKESLTDSDVKYFAIWKTEEPKRQNETEQGGANLTAPSQEETQQPAEEQPTQGGGSKRIALAGMMVAVAVVLMGAVAFRKVRRGTRERRRR